MNPSRQKWAVITLTRQGLELCHRIKEVSEAQCVVMALDKRESGQADQVFSSFKQMFQTAFEEYDALICNMATGIIIRSLVPLISSKTVDPAVLVVDNQGEYVVPLLSGHIGKANEISRYLQDRLGCQAVITTASDVMGMPAVDMIAEVLDCQIADMDHAKDITARILDGEDVVLVGGVYERLQTATLEDVMTRSGAIVVSDQAQVVLEIPYVQLIPKSLVIGIGARKGIDCQVVLSQIDLALSELGLHPDAVASLATVDVKERERGLIEAANAMKIPLRIVSREEIMNVEKLFEQSPFVKETIGVGNVAEPAGYLASGRGTKICGKRKGCGMTISIWRKPNE